ncbi:DUF1127 domain-containing protein [Pseudophaeobacter sp.]|uniref:DUF1127 domain-containing protein n=1 Tax=Pseudophaeobacter sp. TaxID=1971739 RepID=UPI0032982C47
MAAVNQFATPKSVFSALNLAWIDELNVKFARYRLYRTTLSELSELSGRELADLGLNRSMIKRIAYQAAYENN